MNKILVWDVQQHFSLGTQRFKSILYKDRRNKNCDLKTKKVYAKPIVG